MTRWETARRWLMSLFFGGMLFLLASCGGPGGEGCGGIDDLVSCVSITSIQPTDIAGTSTADVDAVRDTCQDGTAEPFGRHDATVAFSNSPFPTAGDSLSVTIRGFTVSYGIISCPTGATCPPLTGFSESVNLAISQGGTATGTFSFVPISVKDEFISKGGTASDAPTYSANYTFTATTDFFEDTFTIQGSVSFVMGNFDLCE